MRILVVDDEPAVRVALERALRLEGYDVALAEDGDDALRARGAGRAGARRPRRPDAGARRHRRLPSAASRRRPDADPDAHRARRRLRPRLGPRRGRRRLPREAVRARGAPRARPRAAPADGERRPARRARASRTSSSTRRRTRSARERREIELTRTEFLLLELFLLNPRQVLPRSLIFERVWGYDFGPTLQLARGLRRLPAAQARVRRRAACPPDGARRRLCAARAMSFRARITLAAAAAVAVAVAVVSVAVYVVTRGRAVRGQVDDELRDRAGEAVLRATPAGFAIRLPAPPLGVSGTSAQIVTARTTTSWSAPRPLRCRSSRATVRSRRARRRRRSARSDLEGMQVRVYVQRLAPGFAVLVARPLTEVEQTLGRLRAILVAVGARRHRRRGAARAARRPLGAPAGAPAHRDGRGGRPDGRPLAADRGLGRRRAEPPRGDRQHDARVPRALGDGAAQPRRRRVARAAHAAHEHPDERRAARAPESAVAGGARPHGPGRRRPARGADGPRRRPRRARTRRGAGGGDRGRAPRRARRRLRRARPAADARPGLRAQPRADARPRLARAARPRRRQPAGERRHVGACRRADRGRRRTAAP